MSHPYNFGYTQIYLHIYINTKGFFMVNPLPNFYLNFKINSEIYFNLKITQILVTSIFHKKIYLIENQI